MKKNIQIILLLIVIIISFYFVYKNWVKTEEMVNIVDAPTIVTEEEIVKNSFETKVLNPNNAYVKFDVKYPSFKKVDDSFNMTIEDLIKKEIDNHMVLSQENWQARYDTQVEGDNIPKVPNKEEDKFSFFSDFKIVQSNSNYISFVLKYGGFSGGAHGYENIISYNYAVKNQKMIKLKEVFKNDQEYLKTISTQSREYLKKQFATTTEEDRKNSDPEALKEYVENMVSMIDVGTEPNEDNFKVFTFTKDNVKIYFAQYQVGPYAIGMPEIEIDIK